MYREKRISNSVKTLIGKEEESREVHEMKSSKEMTFERRKEQAQKLERRRKVRVAWLDGTFSSSHELAVQFGVADSTICKDLKAIRAVVEQEFQEETRIDKLRRVKQYERVVGKASVAFEQSRLDAEETTIRYLKATCRECQGDNDKRVMCEVCKGDGFVFEEQITRKITGQAGDPRYLTVVMKGLAEICRINDHYPKENKGGPVGEQYAGSGSQIIIQQILSKADPELVLRHRKLLFQIEQSANGTSVATSDNGSEVIDVESEEIKETQQEEK